MAQQFADQQLQMQAQLREAAQAQRSPQLRPGGLAAPSEYSGTGSSVFGDYMKTLDRSMRASSLDESARPRTPRQQAQPVAEHALTHRSPPNQPPPQGPVTTPAPPETPAPQAFYPPHHFGLKLPKPRDMDWPGFPKFMGKELCAGVGADFLSWGKKFVQRLRAAQMMSSGDWPEEFKILALSGKMEGPALAFFDKMQPLWATEANTVDHMMDRMLAFYARRTPVPKAMELLSEPKPCNRCGVGF